MQPIRFPRHLAAVVLALPVALTVPATQGDSAAQRLADEVMKASGADHWSSVKRIVFTFNASKDGKPLLSAKHDWDLTKGIDKVQWADKSVTVDVCHPPSDGDGKDAYQRWTNDTYWLLMPLKLKDGGITLTSPDANTLHLSFKGVGLTPGDQYNVYVNAKTHLPEKWDYMPASGAKTSGSWEEYKASGGLTLATKHTFGDKLITIADLEVTSK
jgi:hypothetical protein